MKEMILSICSITYNHAEFVQRTLDGFINQDIPFPYEIIIADDASTDGTQEILMNFQKRFPSIVKLILHPANIGVTRNFKSAIDACTGKYIAICEGDDYWTDNKKIITQVNLLESRPDLVISFHRVKILYHNIEPFEFDDYNKLTKEISTVEDLIKGNFIHTPTCVYRNGLFGKYPEAFLEYKFADWPVHLLNAQYGNIHFIDKEMAVYRVYGKGTWSAKSTIFKVLHTLDFLSNAYKLYQPRLHPLFMKSKRNYCKYLIKLLLRNKEYKSLFAKIPLIARWYLIK